MWKAFSPLLFDGMALTGARSFFVEIKISRLEFGVVFHFLFEAINIELKILVWADGFASFADCFSSFEIRLRPGDSQNNFVSPRILSTFAKLYIPSSN